MADNTELSSTSGGNVIRTLEDSGSVHWPVGVTAYATSVGTPDALSIPIAAALADNTSNPTTLSQGAMGMVFDGSTWDRMRGDSTNGVLVNLGSNNDVSVTGTVTVSATQLDIDSLTKDDDSVLVYANTAKDGSGTDYVPLIDSDGHLQVDILSGGGGGTQYAVDAAAGGTDTGTLSLSVRDDALATLTPADGDYVQTRTNNRGALWIKPDGDVSIDDGGNSITVDNSGITTIAGAVSGSEMQVDVVASLPAGTNAIGKLAANSGVDIGDVDVTSVTPGTGASQLGKAVDGAAGGTDSGVAALAVRDDSLSTLTPADGDYVRLRTGSTGALWTAVDGTVAVTDNGGSLTVDGTVAVTDNGGSLTVDGTVAVTDNGGSLTVDNSDITTIAGAVSGSEMQVDVVGALPAGSNAIGKLAANSGVDIGDVDVTSVVPGTGATNLGKAEDAAHSSGDTGVMLLGVRNDSTGDQAAFGNGDYGHIKMDYFGSVCMNPMPSNEGGARIYRNINVGAPSGNAVTIKTTAGNLYWVNAMNQHSTAVLYLHFYNAQGGSVTVGTTTPAITIPVPFDSDGSGVSGFTMSMPTGAQFTSAMSIACTTEIGNNTAPAMNEMVVNLGYR